MGSTVKSSGRMAGQHVLTADDYKEQGNKYFSMRKFTDSLACYTKAIVSYKFINMFGTGLNAKMRRCERKMGKMKCEHAVRKFPNFTHDSSTGNIFLIYPNCRQL